MFEFFARTRSWILQFYTGITKVDFKASIFKRIEIGSLLRFDELARGFRTFEFFANIRSFTLQGFTGTARIILKASIFKKVVNERVCDFEAVA